MVWGGLINNPEVVSRVRNLIHMSSKQFYDVKSYGLSNAIKYGVGGTNQ